MLVTEVTGVLPMDPEIQTFGLGLTGEWKVFFFGSEWLPALAGDLQQNWCGSS